MAIFSLIKYVEIRRITHSIRQGFPAFCKEIGNSHSARLLLCCIGRKTTRSSDAPPPVLKTRPLPPVPWSGRASVESSPKLPPQGAFAANYESPRREIVRSNPVSIIRPLASPLQFVLLCRRAFVRPGQDADCTCTGASCIVSNGISTFSFVKAR